LNAPEAKADRLMAGAFGRTAGEEQEIDTVDLLQFEAE